MTSRGVCAAAVVGSPVGHSLSPAMHRAAYADLGLTGWTYDAVEVAAGALAGWAGPVLADGLGGLAVAGLSVTMPLKREALALADVVDPDAARLGAANTLVPVADGSGWAAYNTDVDGILGALAEHGVIDATGVPCVLGAGGTAAAALAAYQRLGATDVVLVARDRDRAADTLEAGSRLGVRVDFRSMAEAAEVVSASRLVVSTLPADAADPIADAVGPDAVVLDAAYSGEPTALLRAAAAVGGTPVRGELMLLHQAVRQVELMTGLRPDVEVMRAALWTTPPVEGPGH